MKKIKTTFKFQAGVSKGGYMHFPLAYFAYGRNGFSLCLLFVSITIGWGDDSAKY